MAFTKHQQNSFTVTANAMNLASYVITITDNANKFPDFTFKEVVSPEGLITKVFIQRQDSLVNWVREQAKEIFVLCYTANEINVTKEPYRKDERLSKQKKAISLCDEHMASIQLCAKHFDLSKRKVHHWGKLTYDLKTQIEAWHKSDKDRFYLTL